MKHSHTFGGVGLKVSVRRITERPLHRLTRPTGRASDIHRERRLLHVRLPCSPSSSIKLTPAQVLDALLRRLILRKLAPGAVRVPLHPRRDGHLLHAHRRARRPRLPLVADHGRRHQPGGARARPPPVDAQARAHVPATRDHAQRDAHDRAGDGLRAADVARAW